MPRPRTLRIWVRRRDALPQLQYRSKVGASCSFWSPTGGHARADFSHGASLTYRGQIQVGSLTGAVHLSNDNAGVPRPAPCGRKSRMEYKDQSWLDLDFQYEYGRRKPGLSILLMLRSL